MLLSEASKLKVDQTTVKVDYETRKSFDSDHSLDPYEPFLQPVVRSFSISWQGGSLTKAVKITRMFSVCPADRTVDNIRKSAATGLFGGRRSTSVGGLLLYSRLSCPGSPERPA